ncbi:MAG: hypothetical protein QM499_00505 [Flavobacteriaceae bacterium]
MEITKNEITIEELKKMRENIKNLWKKIYMVYIPTGEESYNFVDNHSKLLEHLNMANFHIKVLNNFGYNYSIDLINHNKDS